jgi:hypothetical protein
MQISGQRIMLFGGVVPFNEQEKKAGEHDSANQVTTTNNCFYLNVSNGSIKSGPELMKASYYICGGSLVSYGNKVYAFGFASQKEFTSTLQSSLGDLSDLHQTTSPGSTLNDLLINNNKKVLHCYKVVEEQWSENIEGLFSGARKRSLENIDE